MDMRIKPLFSGGCKIRRADSATYVGDLRLQEVWVTTSERREAAILVNRGGYPHEILPRLYLPRMVGILSNGFLLQGLEDDKTSADRRVVFQRWQCELPALSDGRFDRDWHPGIARALDKAGFCLERDL